MGGFCRFECSLYALRSAVAAHAAAAGLPQARVYDVVLAAHELATNVVRHGHGLWVIGQVASQFAVDHGPAGTTATAVFTLRPAWVAAWNRGLGQRPQPGPPLAEAVACDVKQQSVLRPAFSR
jgi:anti-sigma regulatory factor (Ser/Thr protein kinase)